MPNEGNVEQEEIKEKIKCLMGKIGVPWVYGYAETKRLRKFMEGKKRPILINLQSWEQKMELYRHTRYFKKLGKS